MNELTAKKSLGQNFLQNKTMINKIAEFCDISLGETIIEIGPGTGALTEALLMKIDEIISTKNTPKNKGFLGKLIIIEKDTRAISILNTKFENYVKKGILEIIEGDFLTLDIKTLIYSPNFKIVGNIPYYITGSIIRKSLELVPKPSKLVFLVQKEVAERIVERDGKGSLLSKSIEYYGKPKIVLNISKGNFNPVPKVDSALITIDIHKRDQKDSKTTPEELQNEEIFFKVLHAGFAHKRKVLSSNLKELFQEGHKKVEKDEINTQIKSIFDQLNINIKARAEELNINQWIALSKSIKNLK